MDELIDNDRLDLDAVLDLNQDASVYASEEWIDTVADNIDYHDYTGGRGAFDPDSYDDEQNWLIDELAALLIRAHEETDIDLLEFSGALKSTDDQIINLADIGISTYARETDRLSDIDDAVDTLEADDEPVLGGGER